MKRLVLFAALAGTVGLVIFEFLRDERAADVSSRPATGVTSAHTKGLGSSLAGSGGDPGLLTLPERSPLGESRTGLFSSHSWQPPALKSSAVLPSAPVAPSMPYRYAGKLVRNGQLSVLLSKGDTVFPIKEGDTLDGGYRVEAIGESQITLIYLPLGKKEVIPVFSLLWPAGAVAQARTAPAPVAPQMNPAVATSGPAGSAAPGALAQSPPVVTTDPGRENLPAQLLWQGPQQVKLGTQFSVALRVTSAQPVRASPMQIRVNPALFETVSVKPGRFFEDRQRDFNYRIDPGGSIFVAASNPIAATAADAELIVLTLKPLKAAPTAELAIASLSLHGSAGRVIPFDYPAAFRTAITQ